MNLLDLLVLSGALLAGIGGYRLGFFARVASWVGLGAGLAASVHFLPAAIRSFGGPSPSSKLIIAGGVLIGGGFVGQAIGLLLGSSLGSFIPPGPARTADRALGGLVGTVGVFVSFWLLLPSVASVSGVPAQQAHNSAVARWIDRTFPRPPDTLETLRRLVGETQFPQVFENLRPAPVTGPPPASTGLPSAVLTRVAASTVKVEGAACQRIQEGSGFAAGTDLVATNAHVVAGERSTDVMRPDGRRLRATVVLFDPDRDLALLRVPGLGQQPLAVAAARVGAHGAVFGHPGGQDQLRIAPAAVRQRVSAIGRDLYDSHTTRRDVFIIASDLHPGDSGGALVDGNGAVVGVAFAIAPDRPGTAYTLTSRELSADLARPRAPAATGPCLRD